MGCAGSTETASPSRGRGGPSQATLQPDSDGEDTMLPVFTDVRDMREPTASRRRRPARPTANQKEKAVAETQKEARDREAALRATSTKDIAVERDDASSVASATTPPIGMTSTPTAAPDSPNNTNKPPVRPRKPKAKAQAVDDLEVEDLTGGTADPSSPTALGDAGRNMTSIVAGPSDGLSGGPESPVTSPISVAAERNDQSTNMSTPMPAVSSAPAADQATAAEDDTAMAMLRGTRAPLGTASSPTTGAAKKPPARAQRTGQVQRQFFFMDDPA